MWAKIISIKRTKDLNYFSLCALDLFNTRVSQFELNYWNKLTFPRHSNLLRCIMWDGSDIIFPDKGWQYFRIHNLAQVYCVNLYIICYLNMRVGQRGGGHGRITELAGKIIHRSTWHTVFRAERSKIWQNFLSEFFFKDDTRLYCSSTSRGSAARDKRCQYESTSAAPTLHTHSFCAAHAPVTRRSRVQCETSFRHWGKWFPAVNSIFCKHVAVSSFHNLEWQKTFK